MPTNITAHLRLAVTCIIIGACAQRSRGTRSGCGGELLATFTRGPTSVRTFKTCLAKDTVHIGAPIILHYFIANGRGPVRLNNQDGFVVRLESERGDSVPLYSQGSSTHSDGDAPLFTLPAWGILGQTVDLTCMPLDPYHSGTCWWGYKPQQPGRYRVIASFMIWFANLGWRGVDTTQLVLVR
jgi:hypothetical protein